MPDSNVLVRLPIAVFNLAFCKLIPTSQSDYILPVIPFRLTYIYNLYLEAHPYVWFAPVRIPPVKSCRWWRHFSP